MTNPAPNQQALKNEDVSLLTRKKMKQKSFKKAELKSAVMLYEKKSLFAALNKVIFFAIVTALIGGINIFIDQVLVVKVLPLNELFSATTLANSGWNELNANAAMLENNQLVKEFLNNPQYTLTEIIKTVNSATAPFSSFLTAVAVFNGLGGGILYSQALGKKDYKQIQKIWRHAFYNMAIITLITSAIMVGLAFVIIPSLIQPTNVGSEDPNVKAILEVFFEKFRNTTIQYAINYSTILIAFNFFNSLLVLFISLLNSEGKNIVPTLVSLSSNLANIILDFVLLRYSSLELSGSALATIISYLIGNAIFIGYIFKKNQTNETFLLFKSLKLNKDFKFDKTVIFLIVAVGISSFLRNGVNAVTDFTNKTFFGQITQDLTGFRNDYYLAVLGAVTPIFNLFFSAIIGIVRGGRVVISYNHSIGRMDNIKKAFWICTLLAICYSSVFFIVIAEILTRIHIFQGGMLYFFDVVPSSASYADATLLLEIYMATLILFGMCISGMLYFQSTLQSKRAIATTLIYGFINALGALVFKEIAVASNSIVPYLHSPLYLYAIASLVIFLYTWYHLEKAMVKNGDLIYFER